MPHSAKKILIIDDAEFILDSTAVLLEFEGYEVITALNGEDGIKLAETEKPDLIICDVSMPGLNGYDVITHLKNNKETETIPFVFLTAFTEKAKMREGMAKGADDYLTKPFEKSDLLNVVETQLKKSKNLEKHVQEKVEEIGKKLNYALPHEFRTVLTQLSGIAQVLDGTAEMLSAEEIKEIASDMKYSIDRITRITENFLHYTQLENFKNSPSTIAQLRKEVIEEPMAIASDIAYDVAQRFERYEDCVINNIVTDISIAVGSELFTKLIYEVLDNAFKFSEKGSKVTMDSALEADKLKIDISDFGCGMSIEQVKSIGAYSQFQREKFEQQGVGIGLEIAKSIANLHNGSLKIISEVDSETKVTIMLPLVK